MSFDGPISSFPFVQKLMSNSIERGFRYLFLYYGIFCVVLGLFDLIAVPSYWHTAVHSYQCRDNFLLLLIFVPLFGSRLVFGSIIFSYFRRLACWATQQIPDFRKAEESENPPTLQELQWYDAGPLSTFLSIFLGLYFIVSGFGELAVSWFQSLVYLASNDFSLRSMKEVLWQSQSIGFLYPIIWLAGGFYLFLCSDKVAKYAAQKVLAEEFSDSEVKNEVNE